VIPRILRERLHWRQLLLALACFAVPFLVLRLVVLGQEETPGWQALDSWPGDRAVRRLLIGGDDQNGLLYASGEVGGLYVSGDAGVSWRRATLSAPSGVLGVTRLLDLVVDPTDARSLYVVIESPGSTPRPMVYASCDGGLTWQVRGALGPKRVRALAFGPDPSEFYLALSDRVVLVDSATMQRGAFAASDQALDAMPGFELDSRIELTDLLVAGYPTPGDAERIVYVGTRDHGLQVYRGRPSTGYQAVDPGLDSDSLYVRQMAGINQVCHHHSNAAVVCVGTDSGLYASTDGGGTWFRTAYALRKEQITSVRFGPRDEAIYVGIAGGGVYLSKDQGANWAPLGSGLGRVTPYDLTLSGDTLYAATDHGIWRIALGQSMQEGRQ